MLENNYVYIKIISEFFFFIKMANGIRTQKHSNESCDKFDVHAN